MYIPKEVLYIIETLQKKHSAYLVGGCVRDLIREEGNPNDYDICSSALPEEVMELFDEVLPTGIKHGTVSVKIGKNLYEVTTYRYNEIYENSHIPVEVSFNTDKKGIYQDLNRRDFTINAMAYDPIHDELIDPLNGREDLEKGVIRAVGDADERFDEDPLRMLRAVRFACQFNFKIEKKTFEAMRRNRIKLEFLSAERVYSEMKKMVISDYPENIALLHFSKLDVIFFPELHRTFECTQNHAYHGCSVGEHIIKVMKNIEKDPQLRFAALFHDIGKPCCKTMDARGDHFYGHEYHSQQIANDVMDRLKFSNEDKRMISNLVRMHDRLGYNENANWNRILKKLLREYGREFVDKLFKLSFADLYAHSALAVQNCEELLLRIQNEYNKIIENNEAYSIKDLAINGDDLIERGYQGKKIGTKLNSLLDQVIKDPSLNNRETLLKKCRKI